MPDPRFYEALAPATLRDLAELTGAHLVDATQGRREILGVGSLDRAGPEQISFCADRRHGSALGTTGAGACYSIEAISALAPADCAVLTTDWPLAAYAQAANRFHRPYRHEGGAVAIHPKAQLEPGVVVSPGAVIGQGATIGGGTHIGPGAVIGPGVAIGRDCYIGANACIGFALLGDRVCIHAGAIVGEPGFGAAASAAGVVDVPQLGRVIIQDDVTIGSNTCIDRGASEDTIIGENTKIDNMVQIAHNVVIGRNCVLAAHTGISGSVVIGDGCQFGGRAGVADHLTIGQGARIAAAGGVMGNVPAGESWGGYPARPVRSWMRQTAWLTQSAARRPRRSEEEQ